MRRTVFERHHCRSRARGFTLVELIISLVLISLLALVAAPLLRLPMIGWMDASRRANLSSGIDLAHSKLAEDLRRALPNSVRVRTVGSRVLLEYLEVRAWGRYRAGPSGAAQVCPAVCSGGATLNDVFQAACNETCFTSLGPLEGDPPVPGSDWVVLNPLGPGVPGGDPYFGGNVAVTNGIKSRLTSMAAAPGGNRLSIASHAFPALSAWKRFYVVSTPVSYDCDPGTQRLTRRWGYPIAAVQPVAFGGTVLSAPLAANVASCAIRYTAAGAAGKGGVVSVVMRLSQAAADTGIAESLELEAGFAVSEGP